MSDYDYDYDYDYEMMEDMYIAGEGGGRGGGSGGYANVSWDSSSFTDFEFQGDGSTTVGVSGEFSVNYGDANTYYISETTTSEGHSLIMQSTYDSKGNVMGSTFTVTTETGLDIYSSVNGEPAQLVGHQNYPTSP